MTERYVTVAEVKKMLEDIAESRKGTAGLLEDEDVLLESQKHALEHAQKTVKLDLDSSQEIVKAVSEIEEITDAVAVKIADVLPETPEDVRAILQKERISLSSDKVDLIIDTVAKYL